LKQKRGRKTGKKTNKKKKKKRRRRRRRRKRKKEKRLLACAIKENMHSPLPEDKVDHWVM
jgi:hypothetical protein